MPSSLKNPFSMPRYIGAALAIGSVPTLTFVTPPSDGDWPRLLVVVAACGDGHKQRCEQRRKDPLQLHDFLP